MQLCCKLKHRSSFWTVARPVQRAGQSARLTGHCGLVLGLDNVSWSEAAELGAKRVDGRIQIQADAPFGFSARHARLFQILLTRIPLFYCRLLHSRPS